MNGWEFALCIIISLLIFFVAVIWLAFKYDQMEDKKEKQKLQDKRIKEFKKQIKKEDKK